MDEQAIRHDKRRETAQRRVQSVVKALRLLRMMAKNGKSPFSADETVQMFAHLDRAYTAAKEEFTLQDEFRFQP